MANVTAHSDNGSVNEERVERLEHAFRELRAELDAVLEEARQAGLL